MSSWIETVGEIEKTKNPDLVRRGRITKVEEITGRPLIIYATDFLNPNKLKACNGEISIDGNDKVGFDEVISNIEGDNLDILIQSPGGDAVASEAIVGLLRSKFSNIRFIVPDQAKSAATMICCSGNEILMDDRSELGPIDPQMRVTRADGTTTFAPAQAILDQFEKAKNSLTGHADQLPAWLPILQSYAPSLLISCEDADKLSKSLVISWLEKYMFSDRDDHHEIAEKIALYLGDAKTHLSHGRRIDKNQLLEIGMNVFDLTKNKPLQESIWDLFLAIKCTFDVTNAFKIIENGHGKAFIRSVVFQDVQLVPSSPQPVKKPTIDTPKKHKHH